MRKILTGVLAVMLLLNVSMLQVDAREVKSQNVNYMDLMYECAQGDNPYSLKEGKRLEGLRNEKIDRIGGRYPKTYFFTEYHSDGPKIVREIEKYNARYDMYSNFMSRMIEYAYKGDSHSITLGRIYEERRNNKIISESLKYDCTNFFRDYANDAVKLRTALSEYNKRGGVISKYAYTEAELYRFTQLMCAEIGSSWIPREEIEWTASVIINHVDHWYYPDTLWEVITNANYWYPNQVGTWNRYHPNTFSRFNEIKEICRDVLVNGSKIPGDVVYFAEFRQGSGVWKQRYDSVLGTTHYWCRW